MRRNLFHAGLALLLVPATVFLVLKKMPEPSQGVLAFKKPTHRVAVAVDEAMRLELASVIHGQFDMGFESLAVMPNGKPIMIGEIPKDSPAFWFPVQGLPAPNPSSPILTRVNLEKMDFAGKTRNGREVTVTVKNDPIGEGSLVDFHGDEALARALTARIADRLAHPKHDHESSEDRDALIAFFGTMKLQTTPPVGIIDPAVKQAVGTTEIAPTDEDQ
jgi:hypothetical protein